MIWWVLAAGALLLLAGGAALAEPSAKTKLFSEAIAYAEGFWNTNRVYNTQSRPYRNNNPGDIEGNGDAGNDGVYARYSSLSVGWAALYKQVEYDLSGRSPIYQAPGNKPFSEFTVSDYAYTYTNTDQDAWSDNVAAFLGVTRDTKLVDWLKAA